MTGAVTGSMTSPVIRLSGLSKRYGPLAAVDEVSLQVFPGEVYALLGLNGAGKTTLIRVLLGMVRPSAGRVEVAGRPVTDRSVWAQVGYLVETPSAYPDLTVRENLEVARRLRGFREPGAVASAMDRFGLGPYADSRARTLSLGNAQRLGLAKALLHHPRILVLDEPVNGLDPAGVVEIRTLLVDLARETGVTVLLSSHLLSEVARVATRIGVLHHGRLVEESDTTELEARARSRLEVEARDLPRAARVLRGAGFTVHESSGVLVVEGSSAVQHPEYVATALVAAGEPPTRLAVVEEDLESHFLRLVATPASEGRSL
jgi:ABC-2 type transport system ATP-binding protein